MKSVFYPGHALRTADYRQQQRRETTTSSGVNMTTSTPNSSSSSTNTNNNSHSHNSSQSHSSNNNNNDINNRQGDFEHTTASATLYNGNSQSTTTANIGSTNRVMQADEDFNIRFVNLVRTHRCLYDKKVPEYRNRDNQEKAWALISKETRESVIHCKERWRNLRACLSRYIKQQSGSEPQHKPYYLTEHMAFLLPFLKSTRNSLEGNNSLATLYNFSQQHLQLHHQQQQHQLQQQHKPLYCHNNNNVGSVLDESLEMKHSPSENDDEETIDAFDPAIADALGLHRTAPAAAVAASSSPTHSETASANSLQNFIPDVQLAESGQDLIYNDVSSTPVHHQPPHSLHNSHHNQHQSAQSHFEHSSAKRIKTECETTTTSSGVAYFGGLSVTEHTDMEFFRSILPDIAALTPQQRRKFKIGILELIDDVVERYPSHERYNGGVPNGGSGGSSGGTISPVGSGTARQQRRNSGRDWHK